MPIKKISYQNPSPGIHSARFSHLRDETTKPSRWPYHKAYLGFEVQDSDRSIIGTASVDVNDDLVSWIKVLKREQVTFAGNADDLFPYARSALKTAPKWAGQVMVDKDGWVVRPQIPSGRHLFRFAGIRTRDPDTCQASEKKRNTSQYGEGKFIVLRSIAVEGEYADFWQDHYLSTSWGWDGKCMILSPKSALWQFLHVAGLTESELEKLDPEPSQSPMPALETALIEAAQAGCTYYGYVDDDGQLLWRTLARPKR